jgi:hypothetical protein
MFTRLLVAVSVLCACVMGSVVPASKEVPTMEYFMTKYQKHMETSASLKAHIIKCVHLPYQCWNV